MNPMLVFVHGAGADHTVWRFQTRRFRRLGFDVVAPDLPGHGTSPEGGMGDIASYSAWLEEKVSDGVPVTLVGHSMGGLISLHLASSAPGLVSRLVLVGTAATMPVHDDLLEAARSDLERAGDLIAGWSLPRSFRGGHPEPGTWQRGAARRLVGRGRPGVLAGDLEACVAFDGRELLERIEQPTYVVAGSEDRMVPVRASAKLADGISGAEMVVIDGCGHESMIQQPRRFNSVLERVTVSDRTTPTR